MSGPFQLDAFEGDAFQQSGSSPVVPVLVPWGGSGAASWSAPRDVVMTADEELEELLTVDALFMNLL